MDQIFIKSEPQYIEETLEETSRQNEKYLKTEEIKIEEIHSETDKNTVNTSQKTVKFNISNSLLEKIKSNPNQFQPGLKLYACGICTKLFETENDVMHHLTIMHRPVTVNILYGAYCDSCKHILEENVYNKHLPCCPVTPTVKPIHIKQVMNKQNMNKQNSMVKCMICRSDHVSEEKLNEHLRLIHRPIAINFQNYVDIIFCDTCQKLYRESRYLDHYPCCAVDFKCSFCLTTMPLKNHYWAHDLTWCDKQSFQCNLCSADTTKYAVSQINEHMITHNELGVFKCVRCYNHYYPNADDLDYHILLFHNGCRCSHSFCRCGEYDEEFYNTKILNRNNKKVCEPKPEIKVENKSREKFNSKYQQYKKIARPSISTKSTQSSSNIKNSTNNYYKYEEPNSSTSLDRQQDITQFLLSDIVKEECDIFSEDTKPKLEDNICSENNEPDSEKISFMYHNLEEEICIDLDQEDIEDPSEDPLNILCENEENSTNFSDKFLKRGRGRPRKYNTKKRRLEWQRPIQPKLAVDVHQKQSQQQLCIQQCKIVAETSKNVKTRAEINRDCYNKRKAKRDELIAQQKLFMADTQPEMCEAPRKKTKSQINRTYYNKQKKNRQTVIA